MLCIVIQKMLSCHEIIRGCIKVSAEEALEGAARVFGPIVIRTKHLLVCIGVCWLSVGVCCCVSVCVGSLSACVGVYRCLSVYVGSVSVFVRVCPSVFVQS